jgi:hypothetical protein
LRGIHATVAAVVEALRNRAHKVETREQIAATESIYALSLTTEVLLADRSSPRPHPRTVRY